MEVRLSRRNLLTLLSKLDRVAAGEFSACTLIKPDGTVLVAEEDDVHYAERKVPMGMIAESDEQLAAADARRKEN